ncbi:uncharacterized protein M421DRAFT_417578 [Didymella exigua CBS 183.55]|uniref:Uncharacterized protein n=1 Tax=Didymella exigua CBS 183.55 TaxID=1150837 RepID=A0A6A5S2S0_9PLEO|nr:uncharacterized protein M421DRAFT_417578 [Didymella exigua CBS 183.55]KAF1931837.1 hypothetical protein M421DRAFT_417578 [Didymella exigua CBS 183.55]
MRPLASLCLLSHLAAAQMIGQYSNNGNQSSTGISTINGRIFTPGLAILDSPQPNTPMGGDFLHVALDISGDGALPFPPSSNPSATTRLHNITLFLTSTTLNKNFTISNGTSNMPPLSNILEQEEGSTVKHVNFEWPLCLVGDGKNTRGSARGVYNISIHQSFRLNGSDFYTIFNLPISVTNTIEQFPSAQQLLTDPRPGPLSENGGRMECGMLENSVLGEGELVASVRNPDAQSFGGSGQLEIGDTDSSSGQTGGSGGSSVTPSATSSGNQSGALGAGSVSRASVGWTLITVALSTWLQW